MKHIIQLSGVACLSICLLLPVAAQNRSINDEVEAVQGHQKVHLLPPATIAPSNPVSLGVIYNNGPYVTHPGGGPNGTNASILQNTTLGMSILGFGFTTTFRLADDFTIAAPGGWRIDSITVNGYTTGADTTVPPSATALNFRIWNGVPDAPGSSVVFGDTTTNRLTSSSWQREVRYTQTASGITRALKIVNASAGVTLPPGTYWLDWNNTGLSFAPPITITGDTVTGNALQRGAAGWVSLLDGTKPQGMPFLLHGEVMGAPPQYYNYNTTGTTNSFPFNIPLGKQIQVLFLPGDFAQPSPAPAGNITSVSFRLAANLGPYTYSNMVIKMGQTDLTTFATGVWYTGQLDTVYYRASVSLGGLANEWMSITLDRPFAYNPARSLVIDVQQCGAPGAIGFSSGTTTLTGLRRNTSLSGASCPFPWGQQSGSMHHMGVNIVPGTTYNVPELAYYTFENSAPGLTPNTASAPVGTNNPSLITGHTLGTGGLVDTCLVGAAGTGANCVLPGWNWNVTGPWTIGFWVSNLLETAAGSPTYLFGDPGSGSFRCFYGGAALPNNIIFRGPFNATGWTVNVPMPGSYYIHLVWDGSAIVIYKDGVLVSTNPATNVMPTGTGFKFGGYSTSSYSLNVGGLMDEFRLYSRALDALEIQRTWNHTLPYIFTTSVEPPSQEIPVAYELAQNYPNPFNPTTTIQYGLPAAANVTLKIYNILGQEIITLVNEQKNPGTYQTIWNSRNSAGAQVASGVYIYSLVARSASNATTYTNIKKMLFLK